MEYLKWFMCTFVTLYDRNVGNMWHFLESDSTAFITWNAHRGSNDSSIVLNSHPNPHLSLSLNVPNQWRCFVKIKISCLQSNNNSAQNDHERSQNYKNQGCVQLTMQFLQFLSKEYKSSWNCYWLLNLKGKRNVASPQKN